MSSTRSSQKKLHGALADAVKEAEASPTNPILLIALPFIQQFGKLPAVPQQRILYIHNPM